MRHMLLMVATAGLLLTVAGCIGVSARSTRLSCDRAVVAVDGRVFIVNKSTGKVCEIALPADCSVHHLSTDAGDG